MKLIFIKLIFLNLIKLISIGNFLIFLDMFIFFKMMFFIISSGILENIIIFLIMYISYLRERDYYLGSLVLFGRVILELVLLRYFLFCFLNLDYYDVYNLFFYKAFGVC